jgi:hypothetical protein
VTVSGFIILSILWGAIGFPIVALLIMFLDKKQFHLKDLEGFLVVFAIVACGPLLLVGVMIGAIFNRFLGYFGR